MNRHAVQLISRGAITKIGNMLYDYGNSVWLARWDYRKDGIRDLSDF